MAGDLSLELPVVAVGIEDATTKKIREDDSKELAFMVVVEVGLEDVLDIGGVASEDNTCAQTAVDDYSCRG